MAPEAAHRRLFVVESVFTIKGRGLAAVGFTQEEYGAVRNVVRIGDGVELRRPDRTTLRATATGIEYPPSVIWIGPKPPDARYALLLSNLAPADVPVGTEVWTADQLPLP